MNLDAHQALCSLCPRIHEGLPQNLYNYRTIGDIDGDNFKHTKDLIMDGEIYLATYPELNDPFEYSCRFSFEASPNEKFGFLINELERQGFPHDAACQKAEQTLREDLNTKEFSVEQRFDNYVKNNHGIFCASAIYHDILMWSHYANKHKGLCVIFRFNSEIAQESCNFFAGFSEVMYDNTIPEINIYKSTKGWVHKVLTTKARHWSYEKEYRYMPYDYLNPNKGCIRINPSLVYGVIMGLWISDANKQIILDWSKQRSPQFSVYQAVMSKDECSLGLVPVRIP